MCNIFWILRGQLIGMKDESQAKSVHETTRMEEYAGNVILHLSDLHFIKHNHKATIARNQNIQKDLIQRLKELPAEWKPNIICITGDISDKNKRGGYEQAQVFITSLMSELDLSPENLVICPGNHDIDGRTAGRHFSNKTIQEIIDSFDIPISSDYKKLFSRYIEFCKNLGMPKCTYGDYSSYLFGIRPINGIAFIVCNSSWFYINQAGEAQWKKAVNWFYRKKKKVLQDAEKGMWMCLPLLEYLEREHDLLHRRQTHQGFRIGLLHHPSTELAEGETYRYLKSKRPPAAHYLAKRVDFMLTGHMHGRPLGMSSFMSATSINCGSTLEESSDDKAFYVIQLRDYTVNCISFTFDSTSCENKWIKGEKEEGKLTPKLHETLFKYSKKNSLAPLVTRLADSTSLERPSGRLGFEYATEGVRCSTDFDASTGNINSLIDKVGKLLEEAESHIKRLGFAEAFDITDLIKKELEPLGSLTQSKTLSGIYTRIALIECTRATWLHGNRGIPVDYSYAKEYFKRAKNAYRK
jgi:predicted MPP superfamily phosphohydrolase